MQDSKTTHATVGPHNGGSESATHRRHSHNGGSVCQNGGSVFLHSPATNREIKANCMKSRHKLVLITKETIIKVETNGFRVEQPPSKLHATSSFEQSMAKHLSTPSGSECLIHIDLIDYLSEITCTAHPHQHGACSNKRTGEANTDLRLEHTNQNRTEAEAIGYETVPRL